MEIVITGLGNLLICDEVGLFDHRIGFFERCLYRLNHGILKYLDYPVYLGSHCTLRSIILMFKRYPSFYKCFPELKKLVDKFDEVQYKPGKPSFKKLEFFRYIDILGTQKIKDRFNCNVTVHAHIHRDVSVDYDKGFGVGVCTPSNNLEDILDIPLVLNKDNDLPNKLQFTMFELLKSIEYSLCYEFK